MTEEIKNITSESSDNVVDSSQDYIETIKTLKATTVSRTDYDRVREENRQLLKSLVNGDYNSAANGHEVEKPDIAKLRRELFHPEVQYNLQFIEKALALRDAIIDEGGPDPFLPVGKQIVPTEEDIASANRVAAAFKQCVEYADGDSQAFTNELQRITVDTGPKKFNK